MSEHERVRAILALAAAGALDPEESMRVERHANACQECRRELDVWRTYAQGLRHLPQPQAPAYLMERTRSLILDQRAAEDRAVAAGQRWNELMLGALAVFGWAAGLTFWILARIFTGGFLSILGANLVSGLTWFMLSTVVVWMTAATAVVMLGRGQEIRRPL